MAFPHNQHLPAPFSKPIPRLSITNRVRFEFSGPEFSPSRWHRLPFAASMSVPKTPVDEDYLPPGREYDVRLARQVGAMEAISISEGM